LWLPFLLGERVPDLPEATGTLLGLRPGLLRPGHLYRAALEGTSLNLAAGLDRLRTLGIAVDEVRLVGGAAQNVLWRQILANVFGVPVRPLVEPESAALGAALQAAWTVRRLAGESTLTTDAVAEPFVRLGEPVAPDLALAGRYADQRRQFASALARLHPNAL
ncbi:MAG: FGGY-family carbohydrate kinase, partial [Planctomycetota bacterium]